MEHASLSVSFDAGRQFEDDMARLLGLDKVPGSGNQPWYKLDLGDAGNLLLSLKWTGARTFTINQALLDEVDQAVVAPGGVGGDVLGGLLVGLNGRAILCMDASDMVRMLQEKRKFGVQTKADARRERAKTSILDRDD